MISQSDINKAVFLAKSASSSISKKYVDYFKYGYAKKANDAFSTLIFLKGAERIFSDFTASGVFCKKSGLLNKFGKKALLSTKNPLSLDSISTGSNPSSESLSCTSESDLCELVQKVKSIYSTC